MDKTILRLKYTSSVVKQLQLIPVFSVWHVYYVIAYLPVIKIGRKIQVSTKYFPTSHSENWEVLNDRSSNPKSGEYINAYDCR